MKKAIVIGAGFGGLAAAIRLQIAGIQTTILEKRDKPGGRAYVIEEDGFKFDCGPTILTAPYLIEDLFKLAGKNLADFISIKSLDTYYRIYFDKDNYFDYSGDFEKQINQIKKYSESDSIEYTKFIADTEKILQRGYIELGTYEFKSITSMLKIAPDLWKLDVLKNMYQFASKYFKNENIRRVFSFHSLLIGGNPFKVSAIYALIPALERKWGVHFPMGGTGALINILVDLFKDLGGEINLNSEVNELKITDRKIDFIKTTNGDIYESDIVVSNADYAHTYKDLIKSSDRKKNTDKKIKNMNYSMSAFVLFFGFKKSDKLKLQHHNIILAERYKELLEDIFEQKIISEDFSQYLHIPTITDPSLAPSGCHAAYTLIPVPNLKGNIDWKKIRSSFEKKVIDFLDTDYIPGLKENLVYTKNFTPLEFKSELNSYLGTGWGVEPRLQQSAYFRPHNKSEDIDNLYLVGANTHPGAGIPGVITTAELTTKLVFDELKMTSNRRKDVC